MSDFGDPDDMLLALAGGGDGSSDDEASNAGSRRRSRSSRSRSRSHGRSQSAHDAEGSPPRSTTAKKGPIKKSQGRARDESEDEGEASDNGSARSQSSAPMDESDSDDESDDGNNKDAADDENQYPVEGLFKSYAEKDEIMAMREVDREMILDERQQEKDRLRRLAMLKQMVQNTEQGEKQKKRKAGTADLEDSQRKTSRPRTKPLPSALDSLKRARAEKEDRRRHREERGRHGRSPSYRSHSSRSRSRSDDSDVEWAATSKKRRSRTPEPALPADLRDIERCRLSRTRFGKLSFWPGAEQALTGCYIRISIGADPNTRQPVYRMAVIKGFTTGRPYAVENDQRKTIVTDQYVIGAHGKAEKDWPFIACSESPFTDAEWNRYQIICKNDGITLPKKPELMQKVDDINKLLNRSWTDEELSEKLKRQNALRDRFSGAERTNIEREIAEARRHGNEELASELQDKLDSMPAPRLAFQTTLKKAGPATPSAPTQQDRLAEKNRINRQLNSKLVREAQLAERRKVREMEEALTRGEEVEGDTSRRVKTKIKFLHKAEDEAKGASGASTPAAAAANGTPKAGAQRGELPHMAKLREQAAAGGKGGIPKIHQALTDDDVIGALDLDIDEDI
ncbi:hypothetical protein VMCG_08130 [Cytospora schulzeri]|uniref:Plus3 domain-containing protein n=1 Tax=Cytospora schulzeri TaxID=448051 RepID=A0A423VU28_9PEZI|nr:hypothetical protein VMCG_08130 [Valsa malicola]